MEGINSSVDQTGLIESFLAVTSSSPSEAQFFLESHNWRLDSAVQSFFDAAEPDFAEPDYAAPRRRRRIEEEEEEIEDEEDEDYVPPEENKVDRIVRMDSSSRQSKIRTLADLNRRPASGSDSEDSDTPQEYYTGGEKR